MNSVIPFDYLTPEMSLLLAFFIGLAFGFVLEQAGFSSTKKLVGVFYGYDLVVLKVFFTGAVVAMAGILFFNYMDWIDLNRIYVNNFFLWPTIVGGSIMGLGFIIGGFCPGTSFAAAAIGKIDAMIFLVGVAIGIMIFTFGYPLWSDFYKSSNLGNIKISESFGMKDGLFAFIIIVIAVVVFWIGEKLEVKFARPDISKTS